MMKKALVFALVAAVCVGCRPSSSKVEFTASPHADAITSGDAAPARAGVPLASRSFVFASLPDRGDLVAYPVPTPARQDGAYTWHRAELSEAHAFRSLQTGSLRITSPSGQPLEFEYSRHVEHQSGDWTWVGRLKGGKPSDEAVITFGDRAAFGSIAEPGKPALRLTTSAGVAWLVETDPVKIAGIHNEATRPSGPDYLVPPSGASSLASAQQTAAGAGAAPSTSAAVSAAAATTVDVVIGYTVGFATALGGQAQAVTRLNNMVETANQAYVNSQLDAAIRMVHALQVNYPDNTGNQDALENLTGYRSGAGQIPVDPAFSALRAARDQYGGDLVTLVRKFQTPENDGCGIAWLIGGGQSGIDTGDAPFGYSIVSDGTDVDTDGKSYFCRQETLVHELGHNMGSQHDRTTATDNGQLKFGVFAYSFGYKADSASGNFYTVMAYGDTGQTPFRVFSNPRTTYCVLPCGIPDQADNARSLAQTMPIVAAFRGTVVPVSSRAKSDVDGDGRSDFLWYRPADGLLAYWIMNGPTIVRHGGIPVGGEWRILASGDFNGDGRLDLIWNRPAGDMQYWEGDGTSFAVRRAFTSYPNGWTLTAVADVDGDGRSDFIWYRPVDGRLAYWIMNGSQIVRHGDIAVGGDFRVIAVGDFNGDSRADLVWNRPAGDMQLWFGDGASFAPRQYFAQFPAGWRLEGPADVDGDGRTDLIWYRVADGRLAYWIMNSGAVVRNGDVLVGGDFRVLTMRDSSGDGRVDLVWNRPAGDMQYWAGDGASFSPRQFFATYPAGWQLIPTGG